MTLLFSLCMTLLPELALVTTALYLFRQQPPYPRVKLLTVTAGGYIGSGVMLFLSYGSQFPPLGHVTALSKPWDTSLFAALLLFCGAAVSLLSVRYLRARQQFHPEPFAMMLLATAGMMLTVSAHDLVAMVLALEITCFLVYSVANETASSSMPQSPVFNHAIAGAPGTLLLLAGMALVFQDTGTLDFESLATATRRGAAYHAKFGWGVLLLLVGLGAKVAAVPFRLGSSRKSNTSTPAMVVLSVSFPTVALYLLARLVNAVLPVGSLFLQNSMVYAVCGSMFIWGSLKSLAQASVPRMLLHASLVQIGITFLAILSRGTTSFLSLFTYLLGFTLAMVGCFATLAVFEETEGKPLGLINMAGLSSRYPIIASCLTVFLLSLASLPPTLGFAGKLAVWHSTLQVGQLPLLLLLFLSFFGSAAVAFAYLRVVVVMWMHPPAASTTYTDRPFPLEQRLGLGLAIAIFALGIFPPLQRPTSSTATVKKTNPLKPSDEAISNNEQAAEEHPNLPDAGHMENDRKATTSQPTSQPKDRWKEQEPAPSLSPTTQRAKPVTIPTTRPSTKAATPPTSRPASLKTEHPTSRPLQRRKR